MKNKEEVTTEIAIVDKETVENLKKILCFF